MSEPNFISSKEFQGKKNGYFFRVGEEGAGYYFDLVQQEESRHTQELLQKKQKIEQPPPQMERRDYSASEVEDLIKRLIQHLAVDSKFLKCHEAALKVAKTQGLLSKASESLWTELLIRAFEQLLKHEDKFLGKQTNSMIHDSFSQSTNAKPHLELNKNNHANNTADTNTTTERNDEKGEFSLTAQERQANEKRLKEFNGVLESYLELFEYSGTHKKDIFSQDNLHLVLDMTLVLQAKKCSKINDSYMFSKPLAKIRSELERFEKSVVEARLETEGQEFYSPVSERQKDLVLRSVIEYFHALDYFAVYYKTGDWHIPIIRSTLKFFFEKSQMIKPVYSESEMKRIKEMYNAALNFQHLTWNSKKQESDTSFKQQESRWKNEAIGMANVKRF